MKLDKLFKIQAELDNRIVEKKGLQGQDLLDKKILALQVELGELAQNWRGFKFWSEDREPRMIAWKDDEDCRFCIGRGHEAFEQNIPCPDCEGTGFRRYNPLLEEYVDCLHFILSIGNDIEIKLTEQLPGVFVNYTTLDSFENTFYYIAKFSERRTSLLYKNILIIFVHLGKRLGFTWEQIEQSYLDKNKINHERQENGY